MTATCTGCGCSATAGLRPYVVGLRCPAHTPAAEAGRPEPGSPGQLYGWPTPGGSWTRCPGCSTGPAVHEPNCTLGPRARFALDPAGRVLGTAKRGPEPDLVAA